LGDLRGLMDHITVNPRDGSRFAPYFPAALCIGLVSPSPGEEGSPRLRQATTLPPLPQNQRYRDVARNRRAFFDYEILDKLECGIVLTGTEVKQVRAGRVSLQQAFCRVESGELWLRGSNIQEDEKSSAFDRHDPTRNRKLLVSKREIQKMRERQEQGGLTIVPLRMYFVDNRYCKVEVGVGRGKKNYDKRESIRKRDESRKIGRIVKGIR